MTYSECKMNRRKMYVTFPEIQHSDWRNTDKIGHLLIEIDRTYTTDY